MVFMVYVGFIRVSVGFVFLWVFIFVFSSG